MCDSRGPHLPIGAHTPLHGAELSPCTHTQSSAIPAGRVQERAHTAQARSTPSAEAAAPAHPYGHAHACPPAGSGCSPHCSTGAARRRCSPVHTHTHTPRPQSQNTHVCTCVHAHAHVCAGRAGAAASEHRYRPVWACTDMYVHVHTQTQEHFPLCRLKLHPPQHTGPCHRGHTGDTRGTCWGRTGDTWGTCLSAEPRSGTHKHTRGERSPFTQPPASIRAPLVLVPGSQWR